MELIIAMITIPVFLGSFLLVSVWDNVNGDYASKHPELNEAPTIRKRRRETERVKSALLYNLESGRLSPEENERLYEEKVKPLEALEAKASQSEAGEGSQDGGWGHGGWSHSDGGWGDGGWLDGVWAVGD